MVISQLCKAMEINGCCWIHFRQAGVYGGGEGLAQALKVY